MKLQAVLCLTALSLPSAALQPLPDEQPDRHATDWTSPESLAAAVYSVVSGPAGQARDWNRYRALFRDGALLTTLLDTGVPISFGVEQYIEWYGPAFMERGIVEREVEGRTERFQHLAHRWSTEEYRWGDEEGAASGRSRVSMQFVHDGSRWWITSMQWEMLRESLPPAGR